jgi:hypothetical protein
MAHGEGNAAPRALAIPKTALTGQVDDVVHASL